MSKMTRPRRAATSVVRSPTRSRIRAGPDHRNRFSRLRNSCTIGVEDQLLLLGDRGREVETVEDEKRLRRCVAHTLVAVHERVIEHEREAECRGLIRHARVEVRASERRLRLRDRRLETAQITDARGAAGLSNHHAVEVEHLRDGEIPHQESR